MIRSSAQRDTDLLRLPAALGARTTAGVSAGRGEGAGGATATQTTNGCCGRALARAGASGGRRRVAVGKHWGLCPDSSSTREFRMILTTVPSLNFRVQAAQWDSHRRQHAASARIADHRTAGIQRRRVHYDQIESYMSAQPPDAGFSTSGFISRSISPTTCSNIRFTFSLCLALDSVKPVLPHEAANAAPSSLVTCL